jgi:hypothetical protein
MCSGEATRALPRVGFPIRRSRDQWLVSTFPGLFAAAHVLHRLSTPRHPPCALSLLIRKEHLCFRYGVFKVRAGCACFAGLSKLNSVELEVDVLLGELEYRTAYGHRRVERLPE